ncbi:hypothetical protein ILUMI_14494, partial [Ignelater luminosus]
EKNAYYEKLQQTLDQIGDKREIRMIGDFNGKTGSKVNNTTIGRYDEDHTNENGKRLIDLCRKGLEEESIRELYQQRLDQQLIEKESENTQQLHGHLKQAMH